MSLRARVGDVLELQRRSVEIEPDEEYRLVGAYSFGKGLFHRDPQLGADLGNFRFFAVQPGDLVLSNIQAWEGAIAYATDADAGTVGTHRFLTYTAVDDRIDTDWLRWYLLSEPGMDLIRSASPGTTMRNRTLAIERFENLEIPLPSIDQQRISALSLNLIRQASEALGSLLRNSEAFVNSFESSWLQRAFDGLPNDVTVRDVAEVVRGRGPAYEAGSGLVAVNQACVRWGRLDLAEVREVAAEWFEQVPSDARVQPCDVLVNSTGEGTIGRAALATADAYGLPFDSHVMSVRCQVNKIIPEFLAAYLQSPQAQGAITRLKGANTTKQTELGKAKLERLPVTRASLEVQRRLVDEFQEVTNLVGELRRSLARRRALATALLPSALNSQFGSIM